MKLNFSSDVLKMVSGLIPVAGFVLTLVGGAINSKLLDQNITGKVAEALANLPKKNHYSGH